MSRTQHWRIHRHAQSFAACGFGTAHHFLSQSFVFLEVQLKPYRLPGNGGDLLHCYRGKGAEHDSGPCQIGSRHRFQFAFRVAKPVKRRWRQQDWKFKFRSQDFRTQIEVRDIHQHSGGNPKPLPVFAIGAQGKFVRSASCDVGEGHFCHATLRQRLKLSQRQNRFQVNFSSKHDDPLALYRQH